MSGFRSKVDSVPVAAAASVVIHAAADSVVHISTVPKTDPAGNAVPAMDTVMQRIAANDALTIEGVLQNPTKVTAEQLAAATEYATRLAQDSSFGFGPSANPFVKIAGEAHLLDAPGPVAGQTVYQWLKAVHGIS